MTAPAPDSEELREWFRRRAEETDRRLDILEAELTRRLKPAQAFEVLPGRSITKRQLHLAAIVIAALAIAAFLAGFTLSRWP